MVCSYISDVYPYTVLNLEMLFSTLLCEKFISWLAILNISAHKNKGQEIKNVLDAV